MNNEQLELLAIGSFARASSLSLKALRLYDQLGILRPWHVDAASNYRYYHQDQLAAARLIRMLRQIDMPLATIRHVLAATPAEAEQLLREHLTHLELRAMRARSMEPRITAALRKETSAMPLEVTVRTLAAQPILSLTSHVKIDQLPTTIDSGVTTLLSAINDQGGAPAGPPIGIYHGQINHEDDGPIEVAFPTTTLLAGRASANIVARTLPAVQVACVRLPEAYCEFPAILEGYDLAYDWIEKHGYVSAESPREIWYAPNDIEIVWPFQAKEQTA